MRRMTMPVALLSAMLLWAAPGLAEDVTVKAASAKSATVDTKNLPRVELNYQFLCAQCHGRFGNATGPNASKKFEVLPADLTDGQYMAKFTDDQIFRTLTYGGPANNLSTLMPPWGNRLMPEERRELVRYIRVLCECEGVGTHFSVPTGG